MPPRRGEGDGTRLVLEHPAGEVAPAPIAGAGEDRHRAAGAAWVGEDPAQQRRHPVVGDEMVAHRPLVRVGGRRRATGSTPAATIASAASRPVSSAWPMPSPVITSLAIAASPVSSTRPPASGARSMRAGIGHAVCRSSSVASGPRARRMWGAVEEVRPLLLHVLDPALAVAQDAEAEVDATAGERERPGVTREQSGSNQTWRWSRADPVTPAPYWRKACHSPR